MLNLLPSNRGRTIALKLRRQRKRQKRNIRFNKQTTTSHVHDTFLYISLPFLHNYDVNSFNFALYGERKQAEGNFIFLPELGNGPLEFEFSRVRMHLTSG